MFSKLLPIPRNFTTLSPSPTFPPLPNFPFHLKPFPHKFPSISQLSFPHYPHLPQASPSRNQQQEDEDEDEDEDEEEAQARAAVSEILRESGVSEEESVEIALNSPKYVKMMVDGVRDLEEWNAWKKGAEEAESFKEKVYCLAREKGDYGRLAFLESIGLSLSSALSVARYLSSESLPGLIEKVRFVKQMFFSEGNDEGFLGKNARRMMMHLSIPIDEDLQQTLSFFEKIEARRGGLDILCSKDASFGYLVESFPRLLLLSVESHLKPMMKFLEDIGVQRGSMRNVLLLYPPIIFYDIEKDIKPRLLAFEKIGATDKDLGRMLVKYPWIISTSIQENYEEILSFFYREKVPKSSVDSGIKSWPHLLGCSTSKLKLIVEQFGELDVRNKKLGQVVATSPQLLLQKPNEFLEVVSFLEELGFDRETVGRILGRCPEIFAANIEKTLKKKLEFLASIGIFKDHLPRVIRKYPELFVSDINRTLLPRTKYLRKTGFSKRDIAFMIRRFSPLLGYSVEEVLRPKLEFLVKTMEKPVKEVVDYPRYFSYSLEKKIKPRFWVLKVRNVDCSLKDMLAKNDEEFAAEFMDVGRTPVPSPHTSPPTSPPISPH